eukprot:11708729-Alexandrium_andersonii.AAC.1
MWAAQASSTRAGAAPPMALTARLGPMGLSLALGPAGLLMRARADRSLSLIHISEPTRLALI